MRVTGRAAGGAVVALFAVVGGLSTVYVAVDGWAPRTLRWARAVGLAFPPAAAACFLWYRRRYAGHDRPEFAVYGGLGAVLGGVAYLWPGVGLAVQQRAVGVPLLNPEVLFVELWLGGGLLGLAVGHFYAASRVERRRLERREAELERHRQRLTVLNRVLRHDVRNRTNVILAGLSVLREGTDPPTGAGTTDGGDAAGGDGPDVDLFETIEEATRKILEVSENARRIERVTANGTAPGPTDATAVVERTVETVREEFPEAQVRTELPPVAQVRSNGHLDAAVENLLRNAVEHNDADRPTAWVSVVPTGDSAVELAVADDGPGLPDHERTVFDRRAETDLQHSDGLGLWLVHWVVEDAGGTVDIADREPRGTTVTLRLPTPDGERATDPVPDADGADGDRRPATGDGRDDRADGPVAPSPRRRQPSGGGRDSEDSFPQ